MIETELIIEEITKAETPWVKELQRELLKHKDFPNWKRQFDLFLEREVWRCRGRLGNSDIPYTVKHPILLTKSHHLAVLRYSPVTTSHMRNLSRVVPRVIQREEKICHA